MIHLNVIAIITIKNIISTFSSLKASKVPKIQLLACLEQMHNQYFEYNPESIYKYFIIKSLSKILICKREIIS